MLLGSRDAANFLGIAYSQLHSVCANKKYGLEWDLRYPRGYAERVFKVAVLKKFQQKYKKQLERLRCNAKRFTKPAEEQNQKETDDTITIKLNGDSSYIIRYLAIHLSLTPAGVVRQLAQQANNKIAEMVREKFLAGNDAN